MQANSLWREHVLSGRAPDLDSDIRGRGDKSTIALGEDNVIDPVGMCLYLLAELGRRGFVIGSARVGERVSLVAGLRREVEVEVPGA